jgi:hypothetical protein
MEAVTEDWTNAKLCDVANLILRDSVLRLPMKRLDDRTITLETVLDEVCHCLPHGGDHKLRKQVARKLLDSALRGNTALGVSRDVSICAFADVTKQSAKVVGRRTDRDDRVGVTLPSLNISVSPQHGSPAEYGAGLKLAIDRSWLWFHESGTLGTLTQSGADLW